MGGFVMPTGGMPAAAKALIVPENIKTGVQIKGGGLDVTGTFTGDATAQAGQILTGQTAYVQGEKIVGSMPNRGAASQVLPVSGTCAIPEGYHDGSGKITQNIPVQTGYSKTIPMYSTAAITLPAGYYAQAITVTPTCQSGTVITNFSASGPLGAASTHGDVAEYHAENGRAYLRHYEHNDSDRQHYGSSGGLSFSVPIASGFRSVVVSGTYSGLVRIGFASTAGGGISRITQHETYNGTYNFSDNITLDTGRYLRIEAHVSLIQPWATANPWINVASIVCYT